MKCVLVFRSEKEDASSIAGKESPWLDFMNLLKAAGAAISEIWLALSKKIVDDPSTYLALTVDERAEVEKN